MRVRAWSQPQALPRSTASVSAARAHTTVRQPVRSSWRGAVGSRESGTYTYATISASTLSGARSQKIQRQPGPSVKPPPMNGPSAVPTLAIPNTAPSARARVVSGKALVITETDTGKTKPAPMPCTIRAPTSAQSPGASAQPTDPAANSAVPPSRAPLRPKTSPTRPPTMKQQPMESMYADSVHWAAEAVTANSSAMPGTARFSAKKSSWMQNRATATAMNAPPARPAKTQRA
ncbi:hypothetical protein WKI71_42245 [Streptomyces sp. MS1.AVA.1]|uniref:Uncharacterized protein n=1 Tax=Streptomyces machairae TaxID=3134109 RepID=A0ABU8UUI9_9ACTN